MSSDPAIETRALSKVYGSGHAAVRALRDVDLEVERGEVVMLVGPSGSGKTTLLSVVGCVLKASSGDVLVFGHNVARYRERDLPFIRRALFGFVFQGYNLLPALSARENVALAMRLRGAGAADATRTADALLDRVGLAALGDRPPAELSGGEMQRVAVARALAGSPPIVLADEPTASLDAASGRRVTGMLRELSAERHSTMLIVTHDERIFDLADRVVHIEDGRVHDHPGGDGR